MPALSRITTPLKALLPDLTDVPQSRQTVGAIVASLVVHLLLFLFFMAASGFLPEVKVDFRKNAAPQPLEMVIEMPESSPEVMTPEELKARAERETIDSTGLAKSEEKPKDPLFESDLDMKAASQKAASGDAPLPSMDGKSLPFTNFTTQDVILGNPANPPTPPTPAPKPEPRASVQPKPLAEQPPEAPPEPMEEKKKPEPLPEVVKPDENQIALSEKTTEPITHVIPSEKKSKVKPTPAPLKDSKKDRQEMAKLTTPVPRTDPQPEVKPLPPSEAGFQPEQERTKIEGAISNRGPAAVDAVRTPLAVYRKQVNAAIASRWYYYVKAKADVITLGQTKLSYSITQDGRIVKIRVLENTSNEAFALICEQSISEAEIGPPPPEAQTVMIDGRLEGDLTFTYYAGF
jgi:outer membrane biosynthesis protein TonB